MGNLHLVGACKKRCERDPFDAEAKWLNSVFVNAGSQGYSVEKARLLS